MSAPAASELSAEGKRQFTIYINRVTRKNREKKLAQIYTLSKSPVCLSLAPRAIRPESIRRRCKSSNWILFVRKSVFCTNLQNPINDWWNISLFRLPWIPSGCRDGGWRLWRVYTLSIPPVPKVQAPISPLAHCEFLCNFHFNIISQAVLRWCQNPLEQIEINIEIGLYLLTFSWLAVSLFLDLPLKKKKKDSRTEQTKTREQMHPFICRDN